MYILKFQNIKRSKSMYLIVIWIKQQCRFENHMKYSIKSNIIINNNHLVITQIPQMHLSFTSSLILIKIYTEHRKLSQEGSSEASKYVIIDSQNDRDELWENDTKTRPRANTIFPCKYTKNKSTPKRQLYIFSLGINIINNSIIPSISKLVTVSSKHEFNLKFTLDTNITLSKLLLLWKSTTKGVASTSTTKIEEYNEDSLG